MIDGSIDLNQSYIKINNTKYQLQAVVGYTVVGNPTIVDGVVTNCSSGNIIQTSRNFNVGDNNFEMMFKVASTGTSYISIFSFNNHSNRRLVCTGTNSSINISLNSGTFVDELTIPSNEFNWKENNSGFYINFSRIKKGEKFVYTLKVSLNKTNWISKSYETNINITNEIINFLSSSTGTPSSSILDLNETYIKINNKLWFNGQPAE